MVVLSIVVGKKIQDEQRTNATCYFGCVNVGINPVRWLGVVRTCCTVCNRCNPQIAAFVRLAICFQFYKPRKLLLQLL